MKRDRPDLWHLQNGGIKATENATQIREFCLMTELSNFYLSGLQMHTECPYR